MEKSYSMQVKEELISIIPPRRSIYNELLSMFIFICESKEIDVSYILNKISQDKLLYNKIFTLLKKINILYEEDKREKNISEKSILNFFKKLNIVNMESILNTIEDTVSNKKDISSFLRGAFLISGSITNPAKRYHFEISLKDKRLSNIVLIAMDIYDLNAKLTKRQDRYLIYLKDSEKISNILALLGASVKMLDFENIRVKKEFNNLINRQINCSTANITKMAEAAARETKDIDFIEKTVSLDFLSTKLRETAILRKNNPYLSLDELGKLHKTALGKSGVNHRLRKINKIASDIRNQED